MDTGHGRMEYTTSGVCYFSGSWVSTGLGPATKEWTKRHARYRGEIGRFGDTGKIGSIHQTRLIRDIAIVSYKAWRDVHGRIEEQSE